LREDWGTRKKKKKKKKKPSLVSVVARQTGDQRPAIVKGVKNSNFFLAKIGLIKKSKPKSFDFPCMVRRVRRPWQIVGKDQFSKLRNQTGTYQNGRSKNPRRATRFKKNEDAKKVVYECPSGGGAWVTPPDVTVGYYPRNRRWTAQRKRRQRKSGGQRILGRGECAGEQGS